MIRAIPTALLLLGSTGVVAPWFLVPGLGAGLVMLWLAWRFFRSRERRDARMLFFFTLLYLPIILAAAPFAWRGLNS